MKYTIRDVQGLVNLRIHLPSYPAPIFSWCQHEFKTHKKCSALVMILLRIDQIASYWFTAITVLRLYYVLSYLWLFLRNQWKYLENLRKIVKILTPPLFSGPGFFCKGCSQFKSATSISFRSSNTRKLKIKLSAEIRWKEKCSMLCIIAVHKSLLIIVTFEILKWL